MPATDLAEPAAGGVALQPELRGARYRYELLGGHAGEQLLLELLKAIDCSGDDPVYVGLVEWIAAAERRRAKARTLLNRKRRGGGASQL